MKKPLFLLLKKNTNHSSSYLKKRLIDEGVIKDRCYMCGWNKKFKNNKYTNCELDHINGNHNDNRLSNLRLLCPNCHSQTSTYRGRNKIRYKKLKFNRILKICKYIIITLVILFILSKIT